MEIGMSQVILIVVLLTFAILVWWLISAIRHRGRGD